MLCYGRQEKQIKLEDTLVVREFLHVFSGEIPGPPPKRKIDFETELEPRARPISKPPYSPRGVEKITRAIGRFVTKDYIKPSVPSWLAPTLFVGGEKRI